MREGLRGLTGRGRCFLYGAGAAALAALILGEKDFLRVAILLAALPLLAAWHVGRSRYRLACHRSLDPDRVQVGMTARVLLRLENLSNFTTGTLLLEDRLPYSLGSRPRIVLERLGRRRASTVAYTVRADVRGRFEVGPLVVRLTDPFGLCELTRSFPSVDHLIVIPQVHRCRWCGWRVSTPAPAKAMPAPSPYTARTTRPPANTGTATTCAGCTGGRPRGPAS